MADANAIMYVSKGPAYLQREKNEEIYQLTKKTTGDLKRVNCILVLFHSLLKVYHSYTKSDIHLLHMIIIKEVCRYLVCIKFDIYQRHSLVNPAIVPCNTIDGFRNIFKYKIQVKLFFVGGGKETMPEGDNIWMVEHLHNL